MDFIPLGFRHIISLAGFDHILFILVLCAGWPLQAWRRVLLLLTGFTVGHSLTLALTALGMVSIPGRLIETLIPCTILMTSVFNVVFDQREHLLRAFLVTTLFGLIHGCGFAGYFTMMLGAEGAGILMPLFGFNLGLEFGQIALVIALYGVIWLLNQRWHVVQRDATLFISGAGAGLAIYLLLQQWAK
jgi:hypothetical protein